MISASSMHEAGYPKPVFWDSPEGWGGEGGGKEMQDGETHVKNRLLDSVGEGEGGMI